MNMHLPPDLCAPVNRACLAMIRVTPGTTWAGTGQPVQIDFREEAIYWAEILEEAGREEGERRGQRQVSAECAARAQRLKTMASALRKSRLPAAPPGWEEGVC